MSKEDIKMCVSTTEHNAFTKKAEEIEVAVKLLNEADPEELGYADETLNASALAHYVRQHIPDGVGQDCWLTDSQKIFWITFTSELGPDWVDGFTAVSKFINTTSKY